MRFNPRAVDKTEIVCGWLFREDLLMALDRWVMERVGGAPDR